MACTTDFIEYICGQEEKMEKILTIIALAALFALPSAASDGLQSRIDSILQGRRMTVGVYADCGGTTYGLREDERFPMMSVFKVHVALAVLNNINDVDTIIHIERRQIREDTYSPMRKEYPSGDIDLSVRQLINYAVSESDNNACDILISLCGGTRKINRYIHSLGIKDLKIKETEASMHENVGRVYRNWTTPRAMTRLLMYLMDELNTPLHTDILLDAMENTSTGKNKMPAAMTDGLTLYHKTGSSDRINGVKTADNDSGIIRLPDGRLLFLTVFIKESAESDETNATVIAEITRAVIAEVAAQAT